MQRFGIDTSILVRLATGDPEGGFERCVTTLTLDRRIAALGGAQTL